MARVIDLQEQTEITEDAYILTDNATTGTHKFNLKQLYDDSQRAIVSAQSAANSASSAAATAREVAASAQSVASEAESVVDGAAETLATAAERVDAAIDAVGDISELAVPEMSSDVRGGAKLDSDGGLALRDGALGIGSLVQGSSGQVRGGIASLTAKGHAEQQSTQQGKNLLPNNATSQTVNGVTFTVNADGSVTCNGTATATAQVFIVPAYAKMSIGSGTYRLSSGAISSINIYALMLLYAPGASTYSELRSSMPAGIAIDVPSDGYEFAALVRVVSGTTVNNATLYPQLELGSTATEYEPYSGGVASPSPAWPQEIVTVTGHAVTGKTGRYVDLEVRQGSTLLSTTPIPLPQRGWVGSLPDGTADVLRLDGAGKVEWVRATEEATYDGSEAWSISSPNTYQQIWTTGRVTDARAVSKDINILVTHFGTYAGRAVNKAMIDNKNFNVHFAPNTFANVNDFKTWLQSNPVTVLYPLATPVTEVAGYIDMPSIAEDAVISIPELDELGVRYFVDDAVLEYGRQIYERVRGEYAGRISDLEAAVAEIVAGA